MEEWIEIEEFPGYSISNYGRVRNDENGRCLRCSVNNEDVVYAGFMRDGVQYQRSVPKLVATAFLERPWDHFDTPINLDGDRHNNRADNLVWRPRWVARAYNRQWKDGPVYRTNPVRDVATGRIFNTAFDLAVAFGLLERDVVLALANHTVAIPTYQEIEYAE